jgi:hypothetical protein
MTARIPNKRTWALVDLDRETVYRLWFDPAANRWEVRPEGQETGTLVQPGREPRARSDRRGALGAPKRSEGDGGAAHEDRSGRGGLPEGPYPAV